MGRRSSNHERAACRRCVVSYQDMTINELRKLCKDRAIPYPSKAKKAELVEALDAYDLAQPIEVRAVEIEDDIIPANVLSVDMQAVADGLAGLTAAMDEASAVYGEMAVDEETAKGMSMEDIRICRQGIADARKAVNERRLEVTRMLKAPIDAINAECKKLDAVAEDGDAILAEAYDAVIMTGYRAQYCECCIANGLDAMVDVVPFESFMAKHPRWTARTANPVKTQEHIAEEVERIAKDWRTLQSMRFSMAFYDDAEAEFWRSLDVKAAIEANNARQARQQQVEAMRRQQEENERWAAQRAAEMPQTPVFTEVEPEPVPEQERPAEPARAPERRRYTFTVLMSDAELAEFKQWKNQGIGDDWHCKAIDAIAEIAALKARTEELEKELEEVRNGQRAC